MFLEKGHTNSKLGHVTFKTSWIEFSKTNSEIKIGLQAPKPIQATIGQISRPTYSICMMLGNYPMINTSFEKITFPSIPMPYVLLSPYMSQRLVTCKPKSCVHVLKRKYIESERFRHSHSLTWTPVSTPIHSLTCTPSTPTNW